MRPALLALAAALCLSAQVPQSEYKDRRAKLQKKLDGAVVLFGWNEGPDEVYKVYQEQNFRYLTGFDEPGAILLIGPKTEALFVTPRNDRRERYNGKRVAPGDSDAAAKTGFADVLSVAKFESRLSQALEDSGPIYTLLSQAATTAKLRAQAPMREVREVSPLIAKLRMSKSPAEIDAIQHTVDVSVQAHFNSWKRVQPGVYEYTAAAEFSRTLLEAGCERHAYEPIFGSGPNSVVLHYNANRRRMDQGEMLVIDASASCGNYASDITRSLPIGGRFNERQRQVYNVVLGAADAAIAAMKPGMKMADLTALAKKYMDDHGGFGKYFVHGLGHHVGLDVHDPSTPDPLEAGMIVTIEPGIYIPEENLGVRIEDVVLVTANGAKIMSAALPREAAEVEKAMAR